MTMFVQKVGPYLILIMFFLLLPAACILRHRSEQDGGTGRRGGLLEAPFMEPEIPRFRAGGIQFGYFS